MRAHGNTETTKTRISAHPDVRISVENFGPIVSGSVDLRPLTVFVGPSNTGKTYLATLIYALLKILPDFSLLPVMYQHLHRFVQGLGDATKSNREAYSWKSSSKTLSRNLKLRVGASRSRICPNPCARGGRLCSPIMRCWGESLASELMRCFGLQSVSDLVRLSTNSNGAQLSLNVSEECQSLWNFDMKVSASGINTDGRLQDMVVFPDSGAVPSRWGYRRFRELTKRTVEEFFDEILYSATWNDKRRGETHYLPVHGAESC